MSDLIKSNYRAFFIIIHVTATQAAAAAQQRRQRGRQERRARGLAGQVPRQRHRQMLAVDGRII